MCTILSYIMFIIFMFLIEFIKHNVTVLLLRWGTGDKGEEQMVGYK